MTMHSKAQIEILAMALLGIQDRVLKFVWSKVHPTPRFVHRIVKAPRCQVLGAAQPGGYPRETATLYPYPAMPRHYSGKASPSQKPFRHPTDPASDL